MPSQPTPQYAAYGATKAAIAQLLRTLQAEASALPGAAQAPVRVHNLSRAFYNPAILPATLQFFQQPCNPTYLLPPHRSHPAAGMVLTDLLLEGATPRNKQARYGGGPGQCDAVW